MAWKDEVLVGIKPTKEEEREVQARIAAFLVNLNKTLGDACAVLGGSGAKGTWLRGQHDADVFVLFPYEKYREKSQQLADILEQRLRKTVKNYERLHGSRDYFRVRQDGFFYEIIPILEIVKARDAVNITDVSPLHAAWVKKNSTEKIRDDIRLAKAFCKAQRCYGAESYIRGFSGYVLEVLTIYYGGFEKLLRNALRWEEKQIVDAGRLYGKKENVWLVVNEAKLHSPLIVIDPVDKSRNAAAALSKEKWLLFKEKAAAFLRKPNARLFEKEEVTFETLQKKKKKNHLVWVGVEHFAGKEDVVGARLLLAFEFLKKRLEEFVVVDAGWEWDKKESAALWFVMKKNEREKFELRKGPPLDLVQHAKEFKKKHKQTMVKKKVVWAKVPVKEYRLEEFVKVMVKEGYFKEKVRVVKKISVV